MILETVYGGWFHKRDSVKEEFKQRGYYHLPRVPCAYFGEIASGLCDENRNYT